MASFLRKLQNRVHATRFEFTVHIHTLQPWPAGSRAVAIGWQRGKRRRGATSSVFPPPAAGKLGDTVRFNEKFTVPATLYKTGGKTAASNQMGPYKKKCLILAILETDGRTNATAALGRVVIDLSEYASVDGQELRTLSVACNKAIHAAVGQPQLTVTIRCRWKKSGAQLTDNEVASMSTDTTGSTLSNNLNSFLRSKYKSKPEEQDLKGFEKGYMETITEQEDAKEPEREVGSEPEDRAASELGLSDDGEGYVDESYTQDAYGLNHTDGAADAIDRPPEYLLRTQNSNLDYSAAGTNLHDDEDGSDRMPARLPETRNKRSVSDRGMAVPTVLVKQSSTDSGSGYRSRWREAMDSSYALGPDTPKRLAPAIRTLSLSYSQEFCTELEDDALKAELLVVGALEAAVHTAHKPLTSRSRAPTRAMHAPARRLARTLMCMGEEHGRRFGQLGLRVVQSVIARSLDELHTCAFWWSNLCHLRGMLTSLNLIVQMKAAAAGEADADGRTHWAADTFVPELLVMEKEVYDEVSRQVWDDTVLQLLSSGAVKPVTSTPNKRTPQEMAIKRWVEVFEAVNAQLATLGSHGHIMLLRHQVLLACLNRTDEILFYSLNAGRGSAPSGPGGSGTSSPEAVVTGAPFGVDHLDEALLPFTRGALTFGTGMNIKMCVTRLQQWAFNEGGLKDIWARLPTQGQTLFPLLRAAADLLMMPKELLMDAAIRSDVCAALSLPTIIHMLSRFSTDEFSQDPVGDGVMQSLINEAKSGDLSAPSTPTLRTPQDAIYYSPTDDMVMGKVEMGEEPGLEYDRDSEDELESVSGLNIIGDGNDVLPPLRFRLLHNLWVSGVPRQTTLTVPKQPEPEPTY